METILFGDHTIDVFRAFYLNDQGEVVLSEESVGDRNTLVAAYTGPGLIDLGGLVPGGSLALGPGPVFYDDPYTANGFDPPLPIGYPYPSILATGITDSGIVEGDETYAYDYHAPVTIAATWGFEPVQPVPEPSSLMLLIPGLLALATLRQKKATA